MTTSEPLLVVCAFWSTSPANELTRMPVPGLIPDTSAVVVFTVPQANQPGLRATLERFGCKPPARYVPVRREGGWR